MSVLLRAMLKKQLLEMTAFLRRNAATGRSRTGWRVIGFGALMVLVLLTVAGSVGLLAWLVCVPLTQAGLDWLYFVLLLVPAWLVGVMGGAFAAYGELYRPRDNELLLSLPIPPGMILAVRMGCVWLTGTGYLAVILVPAYGVYLLFGGPPVGRRSGPRAGDGVPGLSGAGGGLPGGMGRGPCWESGSPGSSPCSACCTRCWCWGLPLEPTLGSSRG